VNEREPFDDEIFLRRASEPKRDVGFPASKVDIEVRALQLELNLWEALAETTELRRDEPGREHLGGREPHHALELLILSCDIAFDPKRFAFDPLSPREQAVTGVGQRVAARSPIEESSPELILELHQTSANGRRVQH
jgi:hypothetical protein